jgi:hypothetical protein
MVLGHFINLLFRQILQWKPLINCKNATVILIIAHLNQYGFLSPLLCINTLLLKWINQYWTGLKYVSLIEKPNHTKRLIILASTPSPRLAPPILSSNLAPNPWKYFLCVDKMSNRRSGKLAKTTWKLYHWAAMEQVRNARSIENGVPPWRWAWNHSAECHV